MISRGDIGRVTDAVAVTATWAVAVVVPLLYIPSLAAPFTLPKEVAFQVAAALCLAALGVRIAFDERSHADSPADMARSVAWAAALLLASLGLSAVRASRLPPGVPYVVPELTKWAAMFGLACGAATLGRTASHRIGLLQAVTASAAIVSAIGLWQHSELVPLSIPVVSAPGSTFGNRNLGAEAVALSLPFALGGLLLARTAGERWCVTAAVALEVLYLAATRTRGAWIGAAAGVVTVVILNGQRLPRRVGAALLGIGALGLVVALLPARWNPRYAADSKRLANGVSVLETSFDTDSTALRTRLGLWDRSVAMFRTAPLTGVGPGNWPVFFPSYAEPGASSTGVLGPALAPRHAHNDLLESLTETGVVGLASLLLLALAVAAAARRQLRSTREDTVGRISTAASAGALVALLCSGLTGFPLEMPATMMLGALALGLISSVERGGAVSSDKAPASLRLGAPTVAGALSLVILGVVVVGGEHRLRASRWLSVAEHALRSEPGATGAEQALVALEHAEALTPGSFRVALRTAHAQVRLHRAYEATRAAATALALEPFSPNAWATLAAIQLDGGDPRSALATAARGLEILHDYPFALSIKARAAEELGEQVTADAAWAQVRALASATSFSRELGVTDSAEELLAERKR